MHMPFIGCFLVNAYAYFLHVLYIVPHHYLFLLWNYSRSRWVVLLVTLILLSLNKLALENSISNLKWRKMLLNFFFCSRTLEIFINMLKVLSHADTLNNVPCPYKTIFACLVLWWIPEAYFCKIHYVFIWLCWSSSFFSLYMVCWWFHSCDHFLLASVSQHDSLH